MEAAASPPAEAAVAGSSNGSSAQAPGAPGAVPARGSLADLTAGLEVARAAREAREARLSAASAFKSRVRLPAGLPGLMGKEPKDSNALVVLEVGVGGGKSARLPVHAGDIPAVIAAKFASEHGLPAAYQQKLVGMIEQQVAIHSQGGA